MSNPKVQTLCELFVFSKEETLRVFDGVDADKVLFQAREGKATPLWLLGHLTTTMNTVVMRWILEEKGNVDKEFARLFAPDFSGGTPPSTDASIYPPAAEVVRLYSEIMDLAVAKLRNLEDDQLDTPLSKALPEPIRAFFPTIGGSLKRMISHDAYHRGQIGLLARL